MHQQIEPPSKANYFAAVIILFGGVIFFIYTIFSAITEMGDQPTYVLPGEHTVAFEKAGKVTIYHEYMTTINDKAAISAQKDMGSIAICVLSPSGDTLPLSADDMVSSYSIGSRQGINLYSMSIPEAGEYKLIGTSDSDEQRVVTMSMGLGEGVIRIFKGVGLFFLSLAIAIFMIVKAVTQQSKYNKMIRDQEENIA